MRQTDRQTDEKTDRQTKYVFKRCVWDIQAMNISNIRLK